MLLIQRAILKELIISFVLAVFFLNFALMTEKLMRLSRLLSGIGASFFDMTQIILNIQPQILIFTIPMALLLSCLLTYGRMTTDNELIILRSSGLSFKDISIPSIALGIGCFVISVIINFYFSPYTSAVLRAKISEIITKRAPMAIEEGIFNTDFKGLVILVREKPSPQSLEEIFIIDDRDRAEQKIIFSKKGKIVFEKDVLIFSLINGRIYIPKKDSLTEISFDKYYFKLNPIMELPGKKKSEMTPSELLKESKRAQKDKNSFLIEFHRRLSMPALCIIIMLLGPPLSLIAGRSGKLGGLTIGLLFFMIYYILLLYGESLAKTGKVPVFIGAWLAYILLAIITIFIFLRVNNR
jgi:lipopolysaccharide export system permease protein